MTIKQKVRHSTALGKQRQNDQEFKARLSYIAIARIYLKKQNKTKASEKKTHVRKIKERKWNEETGKRNITV